MTPGQTRPAPCRTPAEGANAGLMSAIEAAGAQPWLPWWRARSGRWRMVTGRRATPPPRRMIIETNRPAASRSPARQARKKDTVWSASDLDPSATPGAPRMIAMLPPVPAQRSWRINCAGANRIRATRNRQMRLPTRQYS
jgi:hypothetical protein